MFGLFNKSKPRRRQVREQRARVTGGSRSRFWRRLFSWPVLASALFLVCVCAIELIGETFPGHSPGQYISRPIYADVDFEVLDQRRTELAREAALASTPSYYKLNEPSLTFDRIRTDLMSLYRAAAGSKTFEEFKKAMEKRSWPADEDAYARLQSLADLPGGAGETQFQQWVASLPLEQEYIVGQLLNEPRRGPKSATDYIILEVSASDGTVTEKRIPHSMLVRQENEKALRGSASDIARRIPARELRSVGEAIVFAAFKEQPTIVFDQERTFQKMREAQESTGPVMTRYEKGQPFITPGILGSEAYALLLSHDEQFARFLKEDMGEEAVELRRQRALQRVGAVTLLVLMSLGLLTYVHSHQPRIFEVPTRTFAFLSLLFGTFLAGKALMLRWPDKLELVFGPCLLTGIILAIVYPRRFAIGAMGIAALIVTLMVSAGMGFLLTLLTGLAVIMYQLDEIRSRTKVMTAGLVGAVAILIASAAAGLANRHSLNFVTVHAVWAAGAALLAGLVASNVLPFIERIFRIATALTLLEWRDPTKSLLQLLAREAPGTYNHSLVLATLAESACESIGANALLAQVGALYHDIGKIHKAEYFAENQEGRFNLHENLSPTMSLLIILGHVKDGIEMAKEYRLPRVLHQFIEEHHGTTVVRYFHHMASERQPRIASGKHDREVSEAEFRYAGPKPRSRESAVVMLCDGVESAVRSLQEPTVGRIESVVHGIVTDRLNDGQFDDCEITLKEIRKVEDSLVKSLCGIYHGRLAYPKARKERQEPSAPQSVPASTGTA